MLNGVLHFPFASTLIPDDFPSPPRERDMALNNCWQRVPFECPVACVLVDQQHNDELRSSTSLADVSAVSITGARAFPYDRSTALQLAEQVAYFMARYQMNSRPWRTGLLPAGPTDRMQNERNKFRSTMMFLISNNLFSSAAISVQNQMHSVFVFHFPFCIYLTLQGLLKNRVL
jgi:hypothetical protein